MKTDTYQIKTSNNWLKQPNPYGLDATRVLACVLAKIKYELDFPTKGQNVLSIHIPIKNMINLFSVFKNDKSALTRIKKCIEQELVTIPFGYVREVSETNYKLIGAVITSSEVKNNVIRLNINPDLIDHITVDKNYSISYLETISKLKLKQINFYNMINCEAFKGHTLLAIDEIKNMLKVNTDQYSKNSIFIQKIINPCLTATNKHSNLLVTINKDKSTKLGKKITHIYFDIAYKNQLQKLDNNTENPEEQLKNKFKTMGIPLTVIKSLSRFNLDTLNLTADTVIKQQKKTRISNIKNYFFTTLKNTCVQNKVTGNYQDYIALNYTYSLNPKESNELWHQFELDANQSIKELIQSYKTCDKNIKNIINKEIQITYRLWVFNNIINK